MASIFRIHRLYVHSNIAKPHSKLWRKRLYSPNAHRSYMLEFCIPCAYRKVLSQKMNTKLTTNSAPVPTITTSGRGTMSWTNANASEVISAMLLTFHSVENLGMIRTDPNTRTPEIVKDDAPKASITARFSLSGPKASLVRSSPSASKGDDGGFGAAACREGFGTALTPIFCCGGGRVEKLRWTARDKL